MSTRSIERQLGYVRITTRNRVTIPAAVLEELGLKPGDELQVEEIDGAIFLRLDDDRRRPPTLAQQVEPA